MSQLLSEHISSVVITELQFVYPQHREKINRWFADCTVPLESKKWRRFEYLILSAIMKYILRDKPANEVLS